MISTPIELGQARLRWIAAGGKAMDFDDAATALDAAMCQADVFAALTLPRYSVAWSAALSGWKLTSYTILLMIYDLTEYVSYADVRIFP
jgi:hypothetical protein